MADCIITYKGKDYSRNQFAALLYDGEIDVLMPKLDSRHFTEMYTSANVQLMAGEADSEKQIDNLSEAEQRLTKAWNKFRNQGISADGFERAKNEIELVKAVINYISQAAITKLNDIVDFVRSTYSGISETQAKEIATKAHSVVVKKENLLDVVLGEYKDLIEENGLTIESLRNDVLDKFYTNGKFDEGRATSFLSDLSDSIDEQNKKLLYDLLDAAKQEDELRKVKPQPQPIPNTAQNQQQTSQSDDIIFFNGFMGSPVLKENYPSMEGETLKRITAERQEEVLNTLVGADNMQYTKVTLENLMDIAKDDAKVLEGKYGADWINKFLEFLESKKNLASSQTRSIGLLALVSNYLNEQLANGNTLSNAKFNELEALQKRVNEQTIELTSSASLSLNARRILRKFAQGGSVIDAISSHVMSEDTAKMVDRVNEIMKERATNEELNSVDAPVEPQKKSSTKSKQTKRQTISKQQRADIINDAIAEKRRQGRENVSRADLLDKIKNQIKNC